MPTPTPPPTGADPRRIRQRNYAKRTARSAQYDIIMDAVIDVIDCICLATAIVLLLVMVGMIIGIWWMY